MKITLNEKQSRTLIEIALRDLLPQELERLKIEKEAKAQ